MQSLVAAETWRRRRRQRQGTSLKRSCGAARRCWQPAGAFLAARWLSHGPHPRNRLDLGYAGCDSSHQRRQAETQQNVWMSSNVKYVPNASRVLCRR